MTTLSEGTEATATRDESPDADSPETEITATEGTRTPESDSDEDLDEDLEDTDDDEPTQQSAPEKTPIPWSRVLAYGVLPGIALLLALTAGYFKWVALSGTEAALARTESMRVAGEDAVAMLSYTPESAEQNLGAARERLTGEFKDAYTALTRQVVIPGAKDKHIAAVAKVNAAASVSATTSHAVVLLFVNQTVTIGEGGTPTDTQPVIRVVLDKVDGRWLVSHFDPV